MTEVVLRDDLIRNILKWQMRLPYESNRAIIGRLVASGVINLLNNGKRKSVIENYLIKQKLSLGKDVIGIVDEISKMLENME